jgi:hypothetical protein
MVNGRRAGRKESRIMLKGVVGAKTYHVWLEMLRYLVPYGRTHRLSVLVAGMLQYALHVSHEKARSSARARRLYEKLTPDCEDYEEHFASIVELAESLFEDAGVGFKRMNRKKQSYSIAEDAAYEFLNWENMPWER